MTVPREYAPGGTRAGESAEGMNSPGRVCFRTLYCGTAIAVPYKWMMHRRVP